MQINKVNTHVLPLKFEYYSPKNIEDAFRLIKKYGKESALLAGGTDLISNMKQRLVEPRHLVNLKNIEELRGIKKIYDDLIIGATTRLSEIERSKLIKNELFLLYEAVKSMATVQIRNMATIGGNLCNASPAADSAVALLTLDAKVQIFGGNGKRTLPIDDFFCGPGKTVLKKDELLTSIRLSKIGQDFGSCFLKIGRTSRDIATVNAAVLIQNKGLEIGECRITIGAVSPTPMRVREAEKLLKNQKFSEELIQASAELCVEKSKPITDVRATSKYRKTALKAIVRDALNIAWRRAEGTSLGD